MPVINLPIRLKRFFLICWLCLFFVFCYYIFILFSNERDLNPDLGIIDQLRNSLKHIANNLESFMRQLGWIGPVFYISIFLIRPFVFFPPSILTTAAGAIYGPFFGSLYSILGENLSANFAFFVSRWQKNEEKKTKYKFINHLNSKVEKHGLYLMFIMRILYFPFDLLNFGAGLTKIRWRDFFIGTFLGILPGIITFTVLGSSAKKGIMSLWISLGLFITSLLIGYIAKRTRLGKEIDSTITKG